MSFHTPTGSDLKKSSAWTGITASIIIFIMIAYKLELQKYQSFIPFIPSNQTISAISTMFSQVMGENGKYRTGLYVILLVLVLYSSIVGFFYDEQ